MARESFDHFIQWKNVRIVPILHNMVEFAAEVRRQFEAFQPDRVAVEYPETLSEKILKGVERLPLLSVVHYEEKDGAFTYLLLQPTDGLVEAIRTALAQSIPVHFVDRDTEGYPEDSSPMPDPYSVSRIGHSRFCQTYLNNVNRARGSEPDRLREKSMAYHLQKLGQEGKKVLMVCGLYHLPGLLEELRVPQAQVIGRQRREGVALAHLHQESSREVMSEMPFLAAAYEEYREKGQLGGLDRLEVNERLIDIAQQKYWKNSKEKLSRHQLKVLFKFARNYALLTGRITPDFYQLIVAARGAADDNFAYEVWEHGSTYPWQSEQPGLPVLRLRGADLYLDQKKIKFHRQLKSMRRRLVPVPVKKRRRERYAGQWRGEFRGYSICSYPPEDLVIEGYGEYLKKKALEIRSEGNWRVEPFLCSLGEGVDIRETIRKWPEGKIYVKEERPLKGRVGSVVVIFDPDTAGEEGEQYPWCVTWLGEHEQESDMAFYSTWAGEVMEGPGISRCQYGGFMLTYPPLRVYDIWKDEFFDFARNKPERLLMAALDYSLEQHVVYVAEDPPSGWCRSVAARLGKSIIYMPIGSLSPITLKKIRQFHVLDGHPVRRYAHQYIR